MGRITGTIDLLKKVIRDENCERMNKSEVKGYLGELIVFQKLRNEGYKPEHRGNQSDVDIIVNDFKIDFKTSELKDDGLESKIWGWALLRKDRVIKYDAAVCVALDKNLDVNAYYCVSRSNVSDFESHHGHYTNVLNRFHKFPHPPDENSSNKFKEAFEQSEQLLKEGKVIAIAPDEKLGEIIQKLK